MRMLTGRTEADEMGDAAFDTGRRRRFPIVFLATSATTVGIRNTIRLCLAVALPSLFLESACNAEYALQPDRGLGKLAGKDPGDCAGSP